MWACHYTQRTAQGTVVIDWKTSLPHATHTHTPTETHSLPPCLPPACCNCLKAFAICYKVLRQKNARISCLALHIYYLSSALKSVATPPPLPTSCMLEQGGMSSGGQREAGKGQLGWSAAKVYPFFSSALISIIDDATVHSIGKGKTTSTATEATAATLATLAAAAAHAIK